MKKSVVIILIAVILAGCAAFFAFNGNTETTSELFAMDTYVKIKVTGKASDETVKAITDEINYLDSDVLSRKEKSSVIYSLNSNHGGKLSDELLSYLNTLIDVSKKSGGRFDFTLGALSDLWNFKSENPKIPDDEEIKALLSATGYEKINIKDGAVSFPDGVCIDFGAAGKGIALDEIKKIIDSSKTKEAIIAVGGSVLLYGDRSFSVGISSPEGSGNIAELKLPAGCVSTSGNYERYFEIDGVRYHHILDPKTGYPADSGVKSVTIVSDSGILSDALSTACFVLDVEEGKRLAEEYGCEAVFVTDDNKVIVTEGLKDSITVIDDGYTLSTL